MCALSGLPSGKKVTRFFLVIMGREGKEQGEDVLSVFSFVSFGFIAILNVLLNNKKRAS